MEQQPLKDLTLFRREAAQRKRAGSLGQVLVAQPLSQRLLSAVLFAVFATLVTAAALGEYDRKATVRGQLQSTLGIVKVQPHSSGTLKSVLVGPGEHVKVDQPLFIVSYKRNLEAGEALASQQLDSLESQLQLIESQRSAILQRHELSMVRLIAQKQSLSEQIEITTRNISIQKERQHIAEGQLERFKGLKEKGYFSDVKFQEQQDLVLDHRQALTTLTQSHVELQDALAGTVAELEKAPETTRERLAALDGEAAALARQVAEVGASQALEYRSPVSGVVTLLQGRVGEAVSSVEPVAVLLPENSSIFARLYVPTKSAGFISEGQSVKIRYFAFPYQRYGSYEGKIEHISRTISFPGEALADSPENGPVYRVDVVLQDAAVSAYGSEWPLQVGMELEADIVLDKRTLLDWILDPILSLRGKLG